MSKTIQWAHEYAKRGRAIFPVQPNGKAPLAGSNGLKDACSDPEQVEPRWRHREDCNIAIATGRMSAFFAVDIDPDSGGLGTITKLMDEHGPFPETTRVTTPRGGYHLYFNYPDHGEVGTGANVLGPGVDVRGDGGYVVCPPSSIDDRAYVFANDVPMADAPNWLLQLVMKVETEFAAPIIGQIADGERNVRLTSLAGTMRDRGCEAEEIMALIEVSNRLRCEPILFDRELRAIVKSVMKYEPGDAWYATGDAEDEQADKWVEAQSNMIGDWETD